jgi:hypothetical protein
MSALYARYGPKAAHGRMDLIGAGTVLDCGDPLSGRYLFWPPTEEIICPVHAAQREQDKFTRSASAGGIIAPLVSGDMATGLKFTSYLGQELVTITSYRFNPAGRCYFRAHSDLDDSDWYGNFRPGGLGSDAVTIYRVRK